MARVRGRVPVTFSLMPELLALVDAHAQTVGLDRYDVMRLAIAKGVVVLRVEHEALMDPTGTYTQALFRAAAGFDEAENVKLLTDGVAQGLERDVPGGPSKLKRVRKVKGDAV